MSAILMGSVKKCFPQRSWSIKRSDGVSFVRMRLVVTLFGLHADAEALAVTNIVADDGHTYVRIGPMPRFTEVVRTSNEDFITITTNYRLVGDIKNAEDLPPEVRPDYLQLVGKYTTTKRNIQI